MSALQIVAVVICSPTAVAVALLVKTVNHFVATFRLGSPRTAATIRGRARATLLREFLGHTRMSRLPVVAIAHWFTMVGFGVLFLTLVDGVRAARSSRLRAAVIGHFPPFEWVTEFFAWAGLVGILVLIAIRQRNHPRSAAGEDGRRSRVLRLHVVAGLLRRVDDPRRDGLHPDLARPGVRPRARAARRGTTAAKRAALPAHGLARGGLAGPVGRHAGDAIVVVAAIKILISLAWLITIALQPTMGVAWHRFLAFFNIFFKRHADGRTSLGELQPIKVGGQVLDFEKVDDLDEDAALGVGKVEDFTWKGLLDFTTCTECGRCQSQCPAWNTDKPLSPKLLVMALRDHAHAKAPWLLASQEVRGGRHRGGRRLHRRDEGRGGDRAARRARPATTSVTRSRHTTRTAPDGAPSSTRTCSGPARRAARASSSARSTSSTSTPSSTCAATRASSSRRSRPSSTACSRTSRRTPTRGGSPRGCGWTGPRTCRSRSSRSGVDVESLDEVDYLFWVGCAGAYEDRAKKTTRAVAELLDTAGV